MEQPLGGAFCLMAPQENESYLGSPQRSPSYPSIWALPLGGELAGKAAYDSTLVLAVPSSHFLGALVWSCSGETLTSA